MCFPCTVFNGGSYVFMPIKLFEDFRLYLNTNRFLLLTGDFNCVCQQYDRSNSNFVFDSSEKLL